VIELLEIAGVTLVAFVSTNLDSLLVLTPLLADERARIGRVIAGYWLALATVLALCWAGARVADQLVPTRVVGYLGLIPIAFGSAGLLRLLRGASSAAPAAAGRALPGVVSTALLILSMSGDNLGVFLALFADKPARFDPVIVLTLAVAALGWAMATVAVARAGRIRRPLERWGPRVVPILVILIGTHILLNTATDVT
jgi:cadmium resistance protein CadD (predicted permease)